jgi:Uma2 family endonuclease
MYSYPDVAVVREPPHFEDDEFDALLNPTLIVEVLSQSTEGYDRGLKFRRYRRRPSLHEYVLVAQDRAVVERYSRQRDHWIFSDATGLDASIDLPSIGWRLTLRDIYDKVEGLLEDPLQDPLSRNRLRQTPSPLPPAEQPRPAAAVSPATPRSAPC